MRKLEIEAQAAPRKEEEEEYIYVTNSEILMAGLQMHLALSFRPLGCVCECVRECVYVES